jgi:hypothetical protein
LDRSGGATVGVGVANVTRAEGPLTERGDALGDGIGVSSPITGVCPGDATTRCACGLR